MLMESESGVGAGLSEAEIRRGLKLNVVAGCLGMGWVAVAFGVTLTMFLEYLGASGLQIGFLVTAQQLAMLVQIPASVVSERMATRKPFWALVALVHRLLWFVPAGLPWLLPEAPAVMVWLVLGVVTVSFVLGQASVPIWFSWMADLVPERWVGRFWGWRQSIVTGSFLVVTGGAGWLLDGLVRDADPARALHGFGVVFGVAAALGTADILVHALVPEPPPHPQPAGRRLWERIREPFRNRDFLWLTLCMGMWFFSVGVFGSFAMVYLKRAFAASYSQLAALSITASTGAILAGLVLGPLMDRWGARLVGSLLLLVGPVLNLAWFLIAPGVVAVTLPGLGVIVLPKPILLMGMINLVTGALYSGIGLVQIKLLNTFSRSRGRTMAMAAHWTVVGLMGAAGPLAGGGLMDWFTAYPLARHLPSGLPMSWFHVLVLLHVGAATLGALPFLLRIRRTEFEMPLGAALGRLTVGNPLRIMGRTAYPVRSPPPEG
jgi:MFS family permease